MRTFRQEVQLASLAKAGQKRRRAAQLAQDSDSDSGSAGAAPEGEAHIQPDSHDEAMARDQAHVRDSDHCHDLASDHGVDCALADDNHLSAGRTAGAGQGSEAARGAGAARATGSAHGAGSVQSSGDQRPGRVPGARRSRAADDAEMLDDDDGLSDDSFIESMDVSRPLSPLSGAARRSRSRTTDLSALKKGKAARSAGATGNAAGAAASSSATGAVADAATGASAGTVAGSEACDGFGSALNASAAVVLAAKEAAAAAAAAAAGGAAAEESCADGAGADEAQAAAAFDYRDFLKTVPGLPGCYRMYNSKGEVIYVGKARNLKNRLSSYFLKDQTIKTSALVSHIASIEFTVTFSETEALILENELIKKYQPHYNILLRDDKSYPFILLTTAHEHPGIYFHRGARRKKGDYFGPFPDSTAVKDSLRLMQRLFPIRQCEDTVYAHRSRPCLMAQIGKCLAPCVPMSEEKTRQYHEQVELIRLFLQGRNQELLTTMVKKMEEHALNMEFEQAAVLRDQLTTLRRVQESNSIVSGIEHPVDIIGYAMAGGMGCIHVLFIRNGRVFGSRSFYPRLSDQARSSRDLVLSFVGQFYLNDEHPNLIPDEVVLDLNYDQTPAAPAAASAGAARTGSAVAADSPDESAGGLSSPADSDTQDADNADVDSAARGITVNDFGQSSGPDHRIYERPVSKDSDFSEAREFIDRIRSMELEPGNEADGADCALTDDYEADSHACAEDAYDYDALSPASAAAAADDSKQGSDTPELSADSADSSGAVRSRRGHKKKAAVPDGAAADSAAEKAGVADERAAEKAGAADENGGAGAADSADPVSELTGEMDSAQDVGAQEGAEGAAGSAKSELELIGAAIKARFGKTLRFNRGSRGARRKFLHLAMTNALVSLDSKMASSATAHRRIEDLERLLGISGIERMECYDISHTMGELTVGSCVVFNREGPDSSRYRRYNIEGITPGDDFAAMHQVLTRRFRDPDGSECPQLVFIDGGPGQLAQAEEVLSAAFADASTPMPVIVAVAKGEGRKEGLETLIRAFTHERINLGLNSPALQLVIHIRDESHRFAITGHRNRRAKARRTSKLESVSGIGPKRRQALLKHLGGMQEVMRASVEELCKVPGISPKMAEHIYNELHG
ncbi:excinuclease ABC subunit UvrC [Anaerobiospirillum sp. NML120449]|uniref:excinuclease ABC subunit UvrC n=1 Tax=Anaerobiospirillum sp. NML120449 TaxID=2932817 RepID=UPI001FF40B0C|nr:excinuclease ABC subunit UvrC [Anaerobiospirillum sp. NML120449]MCK0526752.1 excinuclease ABC subunit UvrC [Anaerobiospirillum sp. NML120449]